MHRIAGTAACLSAATLSAPAGATQTISLDERATAVIAIVTPAGADAARGVSERIRILADRLTAETDLGPISTERAGIDLADLLSCKDSERLQCWVKTARAGSSTTSRSIEYLLVVSVQPIGGEEELSLIAIDVSLAEDIPPSSDSEEIENQIFARAVRSFERTIAAGDIDAFNLYVRDALQQQIRPLSARRDHGRPLGRIRLSGARPGLTLAVDGRAVGDVFGPAVDLSDVAPGKRRIELRDSEREVALYTAEVSVGPGSDEAIHVVLIEPPRDPTAANRAFFYGGIGLSIAGAALIVLALASSPSADSVAVCRDGSCSSRTTSFTSFCEIAESDVHACAGSKSPLVAPLGIGLWATGASFTLGSELESEGVPLISMAVGLGLGVLAYGLGAALD